MLKLFFTFLYNVSVNQVQVTHSEGYILLLSLKVRSWSSSLCDYTWNLREHSWNEGYIF